MKLVRISFQLALASLLLFMAASCEKTEKEAIEEKGVEKSKDGTGETPSKEKADDGLYPQTWVKTIETCIPISGLCTDPIVVTPSMAEVKNKFDEAIEEGGLKSLSRSDITTLFPDLPEEEVEGILDGRLDICKAHRKEKGKTFYFGFKKDSGSGCEEARSNKEAREWVLQTRTKG